MQMEKTIKVSNETHQMISKMGSVGVTFSDVIKQLVEEHNMIHKVLDEVDAENEKEAIKKLIEQWRKTKR
jgi:predicted CopG family antitoxin